MFPLSATPRSCRPTLTAKFQCPLMYFERNVRRYRHGQTCPAAFTYQYVPIEKTQLALRLRTRVLRARRRKTSRLPRTIKAGALPTYKKNSASKTLIFPQSIPRVRQQSCFRAPFRAFHRNIKPTAAPVFFRIRRYTENIHIQNIFYF